MKLNKVKMQEMRKLIQSKLNELAMDDIELTLGNCSFGQHTATFKLEVQVKGQDTREMADLKSIARYRKIDLEKVYHEGKYSFKLVGWNSRARKNPFIIKDIKTDKEYTINSDTCDKWFSKSEKAV